MIGYATLGTNNLPRALAFYDTLLADLGARRLWNSPRGTAYGTSPTAPGLGIMTPFDGQPATIGNGSMIALVVNSRELVNHLHAKALALGGTNEGAPGPRGEGGFYAAYFRDLDGNKVNVFCMA
jgi:catechol 2,3-dioxygenase-like lactoylglutathione lyase family enzyme